jgi:Rhodopirellula transposase DDE domain
MLSPSESGSRQWRRFSTNGRRLVAAAEAFAAGYDGIPAVAAATGMAPSTIGRGLKELAQDEPSERIRRPGAGRKPTICKDPTLLSDLEALVEPTTRGDPESPLRWTCKSVRRLAETLCAQGHQVSRTLVTELLNTAGYSLQGNRKTKEGDSRPDRDAQFAYINTQVAAALWPNSNRRSRSTPRRRSWSGISATMAVNIARKAIRKRSGSTTS